MFYALIKEQLFDWVISDKIIISYVKYMVTYEEKNTTLKLLSHINIINIFIFIYIL